MTKEKGRGMFAMYPPSGFDGKTGWRLYADYLRGLACELDVGTIEFKNIHRRIEWIKNNRIYN